MNTSSDLHTRLKNARIQKVYSQNDVAEKLNISRQAVSRWENGRAYPDIDNLALLSEIYGVSVDELLGKEITETTNNVELEPELPRIGLQNSSDNLVILFVCTFTVNPAFHAFVFVLFILYSPLATLAVPGISSITISDSSPSASSTTKVCVPPFSISYSTSVTVSGTVSSCIPSFVSPVFFKQPLVYIRNH